MKRSSQSVNAARKRGLFKAAAFLSVPALAAGLFISLTPPVAQASPWDGTTQAAPTTVYAEDFSSGTPSGTGSAVSLDGYTGGAAALGATYSTTDAWSSEVNACNGWVLSSGDNGGRGGNGPAADTGCSGGAGKDGNGTPQKAWWFLTQLVDALGVQQTIASGGSASDYVAGSNSAVASMTNNNTNTKTDTVQLQSNDAIPLQPGHYYAMSAWFGQVHCSQDQSDWKDASEQLALVDSSGNVLTTADGTPISTGAQDPCSGTPTTVLQKTPAYILPVQSAAFLIPANGPTTAGIQISNATTASTGNDVAFDLPMVQDVTPSIYKNFAASPISLGDTTKLTFTVVNTTDNAEKDGWSFTDKLPADIAVADSPNLGGTCTIQAVTSDGTKDLKAGDTTIDVTGDLPAGVSCTVTVDVKGVAASPDYGLTAETNTVTGTGGLVGPGPDGISDTSDIAVTPLPNPALTVTKSVSPTGPVKVNDKLTYTVTVKNTGNTDILNIAVPDTFNGTPPTVPLLDPSNCTWTSGPTMPSTMTWVAAASSNPAHLAVEYMGQNDEITCTAEYVVTQNDVNTQPLDAKGIPALVNTVSARGASAVPDASGNTEVDATPVTVENPLPIPVPVTNVASLELKKSVSPSTVTAAGQKATYTFTVTNTGTVPLSAITINEQPLVHGTQANLSKATCPTTPLAAGAVMTCTATYTASQADIDAGLPITNKATVSGTDSAGSTVTSDEAQATLTPKGVPAVKVVKSVDKATAKVGDKLVYTYTVTNTGTVSFKAVGLFDGDAADAFTGSGGLPSDTGLTCVWQGTKDVSAALGVKSASTPTLMAPGQVVVCTLTPYTVTAADAKAGKVTNTAHVEAISVPPNVQAHITSAKSTVHTTIVTTAVVKTGGTSMTSSSWMFLPMAVALCAMAALLVWRRRREN